MRRPQATRLTGLGAAVLLAVALVSNRKPGGSPASRPPRHTTSAPPPPPSCPPSTRAWLQTLHAHAVAEDAGAPARLAIDLDGGGGHLHPPRLLLHPTAIQPCLAPWAAAVAHAPEVAWWQGRELVRTVDRGRAFKPAPHLCAPVDESMWSPPASFTACADSDDACVLEAMLSLSTPMLWASHAAALSGWLGYDLASVYTVVVVDDDARQPSRPACTPPPPPHLQAAAFDPAAALQTRDALLDRHVLLSRHPREDELIEEAYAPRQAPSANATAHALAVWFWGREDYSPSNPAFKDNFGDMAAVHAVRRALAVRTTTGVVHASSSTWPPPDPPGVALTSNGRATPTPYIAAVGSVLAVGTARPGVKLVWGSGYISADPNQDVHTDAGPIVWRGVRGPLSRALLLARHGVHTPAIRDPALLVPGLLPCCGGSSGSSSSSTSSSSSSSAVAPKSRDILFALHAVDVAAFKASALYRTLVAAHPARIALVSNVNSFHAAIADLWCGRRIIASSLHAVILAHAYSIPVLPVRVTDQVIGGDWKFADHYASVGHWGFGGRVPVEELDGASIDALQARVDAHWQPGLEADDATRRMLAVFPLPSGLAGDAHRG